MDKYFCRTCRGLRNHRILFEKELRNKDEEYTLQFIDRYLVIECQGCETISFLNIYGDTSMIAYNELGEPDHYFEENIYPNYLNSGREIDYAFYLPENIKNIYSETITSFKSKSYILTAAGFRAVIEAICNHLKIKKVNLSDRIDLLHKKGFLTEKESTRLHSVRFIGNDALHEIEIPNVAQLYVVLEIVNHILENLFVQDKKIKDRLESIINNYDDFLKVLINKMTKELIGQDLTLKKIMGKANRLFKDEKLLSEFETSLKMDIKSGKIDFLSIVKEEKEVIYKVEKETNFLFDLSSIVGVRAEG